MNRRFQLTRALVALGACAAIAALAQTPPANPPQTPAASTADALAPLAWLQGCWHGTVNQRDFREHWLPPAGGMMIGAGHTVMQGRTQDYEYVRLESRPDGVFYVAAPAGQKEQTFKLVDTTRDEASGAQIFTFDNVAGEFPQRIIYRRGGEGWLYAGIEGTLNGQERKVIYPMRRVSCETGEVIRQ